MKEREGERECVCVYERERERGSKRQEDRNFLKSISSSYTDLIDFLIGDMAGISNTSHNYFITWV